jgi:hypothetical protein
MLSVQPQVCCLRGGAIHLNHTFLGGWCYFGGPSSHGIRTWAVQTRYGWTGAYGSTLPAPEAELSRAVRGGSPGLLTNLLRPKGDSRLWPPPGNQSHTSEVVRCSIHTPLSHRRVGPHEAVPFFPPVSALR